MSKDDSIQPEELSKTELKRQAQLVLDLVKLLLKLDTTTLSRLPMAENVLQAVLEGKAIKSNVAAKRQRQYIAKLLRQTDMTELNEAVKQLQAGHVQQTRQFHLVEKWRDRLLAGSRDELTEFISDYPDTDIQQLRHLISKAKKEASAEQPPKNKRKLFQLINDIINSQA